MNRVPSPKSYAASFKHSGAVTSGLAAITSKVTESGARPVIGVYNNDLLLLEVKKTQPTVLLQERGDPEDFTRLIAKHIASPLRKLPMKEELLFAEDERIRQRLPNGPRRVNHAVVTLNPFFAQSLWWESQVAPLLLGPKRGDLEGPPYDPSHPHHLISLKELEDATSDRVPHLVKLVQKAWARGGGCKLYNVLLGYSNRNPSHTLRNAALKEWHSFLLYPVDLMGKYANESDSVKSAVKARKAWYGLRKKKMRNVSER